MWKLGLNENKQTEYTKKLMKEFLLESVQRQKTGTTVWLGQREWTGLGRIYNMEIGYQVSSISKFRYRNLLEFVFGVFIH